jgi:TetR/AcrR family transcriptional regulator, transcriptional repressor for nem operon
MPRSPSDTDTSQRILEIAERLVQTRGYNAFSYEDIAQSLHVTTASLHYHFPTKANLGRELIEHYKHLFLGALADIDKFGADAGDKLKRYVGLYAKVLRNNRMCLCGMLAAEFATLPKPMKTALRHFFDENELWLSAVLADGHANNELHFAGPAQEVARYLIGSLEGAMMLARSYDDAERFESTAQRLLAGLGVASV